MTPSKITYALNATTEHVRSLGIDDVTFDPDVHLDLPVFLETMQDFRRLDGEPPWILFSGLLNTPPNRYDFFVIRRDTRCVLHVRNSVPGTSRRFAMVLDPSQKEPR
jgi:hypothetical protein